MDNRSILNSYESTEHALMDSFKAAAVRVTNLYKDALAQNRRAYAAGYQQAFQDLFEFLGTHAHGSAHIAVDDLLEFARQKNDQLMAELGSDGGLDSTISSNCHATTTTATAPATTNTHSTANPASSFETKRSNNQQDAIVDKSIFQIDPNTQFTFSSPLSVGGTAPRVPYGAMMGSTGNSPWMTHHHQQENIGDTLKRRHTGAELSFMGRPLNNMDVDASEPSMKRNKGAK